MKTKVCLLTLLLVCALGVWSVAAEVLFVSSARVSVSAMSAADGVNVIKLDQVIDPSCSDTIYIDRNDRDLYALALGAALSGQTVSGSYITNAEAQSFGGNSFTCKAWFLTVP